MMSKTHLLSVSQYMTPAPFAASAKEPLRTARRLMDEHEIRHLPVEEQGKLVGVLSNRDLDLVWSLAHAPSEALTVADAMTPNPFTVHPDARLDDVVRVMAERKIGSAVVLNDAEHVIGIFTSTDAMCALADVLEERSRR